MSEVCKRNLAACEGCEREEELVCMWWITMWRNPDCECRHSKYRKRWLEARGSDGKERIHNRGDV